MIFDGPQKSDCVLEISSTFVILNGDDGVKIISDDPQKLVCDLVKSSFLIFNTADDDGFNRNFVGSDPKINYHTNFKLFIRNILQINIYIHIVIQYKYQFWKYKFIKCIK